MATINEFIYHHAPFSGGNKADWEFTLSSNFPVADIAEISMQVRDSSGRMIIPEKLLTAGSITMAGYDIAMEFTAAEMKNKPGVHTYGLDFISADGEPFATISGKFPILAETNKR